MVGNAGAPIAGTAEIKQEWLILVDEARRGDISAFDLLVYRFRDMACRIALQICSRRSPVSAVFPAASTVTTL